MSPFAGCVGYWGTLPDEERTPEEVSRDMELATLTGRPGGNVKGPSPLASLPQFDLVWGFSVDYKHCVLFGVTRQFTSTSLTPKTVMRISILVIVVCIVIRFLKKNVPLPFLK